MKRKVGTCEKCKRPVVVLTGKDIPKQFRGWTSAYCDFVGRNIPEAKKYHHDCYDSATLAEHQALIKNH